MTKLSMRSVAVICFLFASNLPLNLGMEVKARRTLLHFPECQTFYAVFLTAGMIESLCHHVDHLHLIDVRSSDFVGHRGVVRRGLVHGEILPREQVLRRQQCQQIFFKISFLL